MATSSHGKGGKLRLELGDILYEVDEEIEVVQSRWSRDTLIVYSRVNPATLYLRLMHWPPAYAARVTPLLWELNELESVLPRLLEGLKLTEVNVEVHERGSRVSRMVREAVGRIGVRVRRKSAYWVVVEHLEGEANGWALLPARCDRVDLWWSERRKECIEGFLRVVRVAKLSK